MKRAVLIVFIVLAGGLSAQTTEILTSDRPGQTFSANTVGKGVFQIQSGLGYDQFYFEDVTFRDESNNPANTDLRVWGYFINTDLRYGLMERFEVGVNLISSHAGSEMEQDYLNYNSIQDGNFEALVSLRANLFSSKNFNLAALASGIITEPTFLVRTGLAGSFDINSNNSLSANLFYIFGDTPGLDPLLFTLNYGYSFGKMGVFVEAFGEVVLFSTVINEPLWRTFYDAGVWYLINDNFQVDFSLGTGINSEFKFFDETKSTRFFSEIGLTYRIK